MDKGISPKEQLKRAWRKERQNKLLASCAVIILLIFVLFTVPAGIILITYKAGWLSADFSSIVVISGAIVFVLFLLVLINPVIQHLFDKYDL